MLAKCKFKTRSGYNLVSNCPPTDWHFLVWTQWKLGNNRSAQNIWNWVKPSLRLFFKLQTWPIHNRISLIVWNTFCTHVASLLRLLLCLQSMAPDFTKSAITSQQWILEDKPWNFSTNYECNIEFWRQIKLLNAPGTEKLCGYNHESFSTHSKLMTWIDKIKQVLWINVKMIKSSQHSFVTLTWFH